MRRELTIHIIWALALLTALAVTAQAAQITTSASVPLTKTDWEQILTLHKFDPTLGSLNFITFTLGGTVVGTVGLENLANTEATVEAGFGALMSLKKGLLPLVTVAPAYANTFTLDPYDGHLDWGGASGVTHTGLTAGASNSQTIFAGFDDFIGPGTIDLTASAIANSLTRGTGNVASYYETQASAEASIIYDYTPVPEPISLTVLGSGLVAAVGFARRRRR